MKVAGLILAMSWLAFAQPGPPAMVVAQQGTAVRVLQTLKLGETLKLPEGAQLTVSFLEGGGRSQCQGPGVFQVGDTQMTLLSGQGQVRSEKIKARAALPPRPWINWDEMAGVRRDEFIYSGDRASLEPTVQLAWLAPDDLSEVEVVVEHLPDYRRVYKATVRADSPPPLHLEPGQTYTVSLRGFSPRRIVEAAEQRLEVLSSRDRDELLTWESDVKTPADRVELYSWLLSRGLLSRAQKMLPQLQADGALP